MTSNLRRTSEGSFEVLDYTLFLFGVIRGDHLEVGEASLPKFVGVGVWELDGQLRAGIPQVETKSRSLLTRLGGLFVAGRVEFTVLPTEQPRLRFLGSVAATRRM